MRVAVSTITGTIAIKIAIQPWVQGQVNDCYEFIWVSKIFLQVKLPWTTCQFSLPKISPVLYSVFGFISGQLALVTSALTITEVDSSTITKATFTERNMFWRSFTYSVLHSKTSQILSVDDSWVMFNYLSICPRCGIDIGFSLLTSAKTYNRREC